MKSFYEELFTLLKTEKYTKDQFTKLKTRLSKKHALGHIPTDIDVMLKAPKSLSQQIKFLKHKPTRTISGVAVCSLMAKPLSCPHGKCVMCPGGPGSVFGDVPQSYTGKEPATMRAIRNDFSAYLQIMGRLHQYAISGHAFDKVEVIIQGGTFPSFSKAYQKNFVRDIFQALNDFGREFLGPKGLRLDKLKKFWLLDGDFREEVRISRIHKRLRELQKKDKTTMEQSQKQNEKSKVRCVGLTIETKPDWAMLKHANSMLELGCTRVELGFQTDDNTVLKTVNRGHTVQDTYKSTQIMKDLGFKINYHVMLGLPGAPKANDKKMLSRIFSNPSLRPDMLKIYPCMVMPGTTLHRWWKAGRYKPMTTKTATKVIADFMLEVPEYVRVMRVQRDIPTHVTSAGVDRTNLRQYVDKTLTQRSREIRSREIGHVLREGKLPTEIPVLKVLEYEASGGWEFFLSFEYPSIDAIAGYCRMRFPSDTLRKEITDKSAIIRELHVMGSAIPIGKGGAVQHSGLGKRLLAKAESIAKQHGKKKIVIISGIGVREYYRKLGYTLEGPYMVK